MPEAETRGTRGRGGGARARRGCPGTRRRGSGGRRRGASQVPQDDLVARHCGQVLLTDRSSQTGAVRYRYTGLVWAETGQYRWNSNFAVQPVRTGIPVGLAGIPAGLTGNQPNSIFF